MLHPLLSSEKTERAGPALPHLPGWLLHLVPVLPPTEFLFPLRRGWSAQRAGGCHEESQVVHSSLKRRRKKG